MRIYINKIVYDRVNEYAKAQRLTVSQFVEASLIKNLGLEGVNIGARVIPMDENEIFGGDKTNE
jgi:hypothetical protein